MAAIPRTLVSKSAGTGAIPLLFATSRRRVIAWIAFSLSPACSCSVASCSRTCICSAGVKVALLQHLFVVDSTFRGLVRIALPIRPAKDRGEPVGHLPRTLCRLAGRGGVLFHQRTLRIRCNAGEGDADPQNPHTLSLRAAILSYQNRHTLDNTMYTLPEPELAGERPNSVHSQRKHQHPRRNAGCTRYAVQH